MERRFTAAISLTGLALALWLAATAPLRLEEAVLWDHLVRPSLRTALFAPDSWNGIFYAMLAERAIGLLRLSEFSLRAPALLAGLVAAWVVWKQGSLLLTVAYAIAAAIGWFSTAQGHGIAFAFCLLAAALPRHAGWLFGLAIVASPVFALAAVACWSIARLERVVIPAFAVALAILLIPASHAGPTTSSDPRPDFYREKDRRNTARGGGFQPSVDVSK